MRIKNKVFRCKARSKPKPKRNILAIARKAGTTVFLMSLERAEQKRCMPFWSNKDEIHLIYIKAQQMRLLSGKNFHVDHIIPITHRLVCGLHVPDNLAIITKEANERKSNNFKIIHTICKPSAAKKPKKKV